VRERKSLVADSLNHNADLRQVSTPMENGIQENAASVVAEISEL
jgi:hypothetical protein